MKSVELDKHSIIDGFNRAAHSYDGSACLQREVAERLLERLTLIKYQPKTILDLGAGTGECSLKLAEMYPQANIVAMDIADEMLQVARQKLVGVTQQQNILQKLKTQIFTSHEEKHYSFICADAEALPFKNNSIDLIFSSLAIQWCEDLDSLFRDFQRILSKDGFVLFATFGVDTLKELKQSWSSVDHYGHVNNFSDLHDIGDKMLASGFRDPVVDAEFIVVEYEKIIELLKDLKAIGAQNHLAARKKGLMTRTKLNKMLSNYEHFKLPTGKYPATYEVVYGHAWGRDLELMSEPQMVGQVSEQLVHLKK